MTDILFHKKDHNTFVITFHGKDYFFKPDDFSSTMDMTEYNCRSHGKYIVMEYWWRSQSWGIQYTRETYPTAEEALINYFQKLML